MFLFYFIFLNSQWDPMQSDLDFTRYTRAKRITKYQLKPETAGRNELAFLLIIIKIENVPNSK